MPDEDDALTLKDMMELLVLDDLPPANKWTHRNFDALCLFVMNYVVKIYGIAKVAEMMKKNPGLIVVEWLHPSDYGWAVFVIQNACDRWNQEFAIARSFILRRMLCRRRRRRHPIDSWAMGPSYTVMLSTMKARNT